MSRVDYGPAEVGSFHLIWGPARMSCGHLSAADRPRWFTFSNPGCFCSWRCMDRARLSSADATRTASPTGAATDGD